MTACALCGEQRELTYYGGHGICAHCAGRPFRAAWNAAGREPTDAQLAAAVEEAVAAKRADDAAALQGTLQL